MPISCRSLAIALAVSAPARAAAREKEASPLLARQSCLSLSLSGIQRHSLLFQLDCRRAIIIVIVVIIFFAASSPPACRSLGSIAHYHLQAKASLSLSLSISLSLRGAIVLFSTCARCCCCVASLSRAHSVLSIACCLCWLHSPTACVSVSLGVCVFVQRVRVRRVTPTTRCCRRRRSALSPLSPSVGCNSGRDEH